MKASKTLIGAFVVGAALLSIAAVLLFGSGRFFEERVEYVLYFEGSVAGLNPGAPVLLSGVKIGAVKEISIQFHVRDLTFRTPVVIETYDNFVLVGAEELGRELKEDHGGDRERLRRAIVGRLVERGLRAQLQLQSFVTGQLAVEIVFRPQSPGHLMGGEGPYQELPTIRSEMEEVMQTLQDLPIKEIVSEFRAVVTRANEILSAPEVKESVASVSEMTKSLSSLAHKWDERSEGIIEGARDLIVRLEAIAGKIEGRIDPLAADISESTEEIQATLEQMRRTLDSLEKSVRGDSSLLRDTRTALKSLTEAMDSLRVLTDYLERHPEALLRGKAEG